MMSLAGVLCTGTFLVVPTAWAQTAPLRPAPAPNAALPLENDARLGPLFTHGVEALLGQRFDEALSTFESLYRQSPRPTLLYHLGKVALAQQRYVAAADLYRRFLKGSGEEVDADTRLEVQQFLASAPPAECEVTVQGEAGALLLSDGRIVGILPLDQPLQLAPGTHRLILEKGRRKVETQVMLTARRRAEVRFTLLPPLALLTMTPGVLLVMQMEPRALEPSLAPLLQNALQTAVAQQNAVLISSETQAELLHRSTDLNNCLDQTVCQERLGQMASAQFVLHLDVRSESSSQALPATHPSPRSGVRPGGRPPSRALDKGSVFRFTAKLLDVDVGMVSVEATQGCADCSLKRAIAQLADSVQELLRQAVARPRGTLVVESEPVGALVQFDGHTLGNTPYRREAFVGPHEVTISKAGYSSHTDNISITDGESTRLEVNLPQIEPTAVKSGRARRIAKWVLLGSGVALTVIGGTLLGLNGRQSCSARGTMCTTFDGQSAGVPLLVLGLGGLGGAGALFLLDRSNPTLASTQNSAVGVTLLGF